MNFLYGLSIFVILNLAAAQAFSNQVSTARQGSADIRKRLERVWVYNRTNVTSTCHGSSVIEQQRVEHIFNIFSTRLI